MSKKLVYFWPLLALLAACTLPPPGPYTLAPDAGQPVTPQTYTVCEGDQCWRLYVRNPTPAPVATATPTPATTSPTPWPTPTSEVITPLPTSPLPTATPVKTCALRALVILNIRDAPTTAGGIVGKWGQGEDLTLSQFNTADPGYVWGRVRDGWAAIYTRDTGGDPLDWYTTGTTSSSLCSDVPGWPTGVQPPLPFADWIAPDKYGAHLLTGAATTGLGQYGIIKGISGNAYVVKAVHAANPDVLIIWRNWTRYLYGSGDGPPDWGTGDPVQVANEWWIAEYYTWLQLGLIQPDRAAYAYDVVDLFEYRNELGYVGDWEIAFDLRILALASEHRICLAMFSDGYGNPTLSQFDARAPVLDVMVATECQPGRRHVISAHSYSRYDSGPWLFDRWQSQRQYWRERHGDTYDVLQWVFTEFGVKDTDAPPYDYDGRGTVHCAVALAELPAINARFAAHPDVIGYTIFGIGELAPWTNWGRCH